MRELILACAGARDAVLQSLRKAGGNPNLIDHASFVRVRDPSIDVLRAGARLIDAGGALSGLMLEDHVPGAETKLQGHEGFMLFADTLGDAWRCLNLWTLGEPIANPRGYLSCKIGIPRSERAIKDVSEDMPRFYGDYARQEVGGARVLFAEGLDAARRQNLERMIVAGPSAFGIAVDEAPDSLIDVRRTGACSLYAEPISLSDLDGVRHGPLFTAPAATRSKVYQERGRWLANGCSYALIIFITAKRRCAISVPAGAVFEAPFRANFEAFATMEAVTREITAPTATIAVPAWPLTADPGLGGWLFPTPLVSPAALGPIDIQDSQC
jgi:hypothetical protein